MRLLSTMVCHNRAELTRRCVESYLATVTVPFQLVIVDNKSTDDTRPYLVDLLQRDPVMLGDVDVVFSPTNDYPGRACNRAWTNALNAEAYFGWEPFTHLHRSDNDVEYLPGWCDEIAERFQDPEVGQVGLLEEKYERGCFNVGGNAVVRRSVWDAGVRWDETPWGGRPAAPALNEDALMSAAVSQLGLRVVRVSRQVVVHHGWDFDAYPAYYERTCADRGYDVDHIRSHFDRMRAL